MFSNILSKLFRSSGDDIARGVANSASRGLASSLARNYGDDLANVAVASASRGLGKSALSNLGREIADDTAQSVVKKGGFLNSVADLLEKSGETAMNTGRSVTRAGMAKVAPDAKHNIAEVFRRTGISDPGAQAELGRTLTGTEDAILDKAINSTRSATDVLDMTHFDLPTREYEAVLNSFPSNLRPLIDHYTPTQMEKLLKSEGSRLMYTANKAGDKTLGGLMMDMGDKIATGIDNAVEQVRPGATQELYENSINELKRLAGEARLQNNTPFMKAYDKLAQELEATPAAERTIANLRSFKRDFVNGEKLERLSDQAQGGGALLGNSGGGRGMGGMPKGLTNLLDTLVGTPAQAATGKLGSTLVGAADKLRDEGVQKAIKRGAVAVGGIGALSMLGDQLGGRQARGSSMPGGGSEADGMGSAMGGVAGNPRDVSNGLAAANSASNDTIAGYSREDLENAYVKALMDGNTKAGKSIASIIDLLDSRTKATAKASTAKSSAADAKTAAKQNSARTRMSNLMKLYRQAGGGHGVGGHLTNALNAITADSVNPAAGAYNSQRQALAVALARASGDSGTLSDMDIKSYMSMVPDIADNPTKARLKIQSIYNMLGQ
jgi:hypothetical protein|nr:MAG TPA: hypothetical protein [Caudoviricetes sp.]